MLVHRFDRDTVTSRECAVCGQPDVYPRCDHRQYIERRFAADDICIDCDEIEINCRCEARHRCSCGVPSSVCPCAYGETA